MRRFVNKLLEKLIIKNIDIIQIKDYIPSPTILNNYQESLNSHYIFRKGKEKDTKEANIDSYINIEDKLKEEIKLSENHYEVTKNDKTKIYPKILYVKENDITKILKILFRMKTACNEIFYFIKEKVNVNDYIFNNFRIDIKAGNDLGSENRIILNNSKMNTVGENIKISIKKVAEFIAYGNPTHKIMNDLKFHSEKFSSDCNSLKQQKIALMAKYNFSDLNSYKEEILDIKNKMNKDLSHFVLSEYDQNLKNNEIDIIANYLHKNLFNLNDIQIIEEDINNQKIKEEISYINNLRKKMNIKQKLKLSLTFKDNINIINIKRKIDKILPFFDKIEEIENKVKDFNTHYEEVLQNLNNEINKIKNSIKFINREDIFINVSKDDFITTIENILKNESINFFDIEINNFYLFIYLLKKKLYDNDSFKMALGISEILSKYVKIISIISHNI